ncbi:MAG TPA: TonB-dependent receptor [Burkholderiales bacterium]|nr:TonB-dependent receptor [Burkholderiales bacterium]
MRKRASGLLVLLLLSRGLAAAESNPDFTELSLEQLMDIPVTGASKYEQKQEDVAAAVSVITRDEIKTFGWRTLAEALVTLPGVYPTYDRQYTYLGTRGFGLPGDFNTRILLTLNGDRLNDVVYDQAPIGRDLPLDMDLIERIEFIPGPGGAVYGQNALFGVVNIVTRSGLDIDGIELAAAAHTLEKAGEGRATLGKRLSNGLDIVLSASGYHAKGQDLFMDFGSTGVSGVAAGLDGERDKDLFVSFARGAWSFDLAYGDRRKDDPTASYFADPLAGGYQRDARLDTQLQYREHFADDRMQLLGRLFFGQYRYKMLGIYGTPFLSTAAGQWQGVELRLLSTGWTNHKLMFGLEYQDVSRRDLGIEDLAAPANDIDVPGRGWRAGAYVQDEWILHSQLSATIGLRLDRDEKAGAALSPRIGVIWRPTERASVKALYGRAYREPNAFERDYFDGVSQVANPGLSRETIDTLELVLEQRLGTDLRLRASGYLWEMHDIITLGIDPVSGLSQFQSGQNVEARGVELSADKTWAWGARLRGSLSYQAVTPEGGAHAINSPRWLGKLNFSGPVPRTGLRLGFESQYSSSRESSNGTMLNPSWLSNLQLLADKWMKGLEVAVGIYNVFNYRYSQPAADTNWQNALEQDGRSVRLKLSYRF